MDRSISKQEYFIVGCLIGLAVLLRLVYVFQLGEPSFPDARKYDQFALSLISSNSYNQKIAVMPGYSFFLAGIYSMFGHSFKIVRIIQALMGGGICWLIYVLAKRVYDKRIGLVALCISVIYPTLIFYSGEIVTEYLFTFLMVLFIYSFLKFIKDFSIKWTIMCGMVLGLSLLTRPVLVFFPAIIVFWVLSIRKLGLLETTYKLSIMFLLTSLLLTPWVIRNYRIFNAFVPFNTSGGHDFYVSNYPKGDGTASILNEDVIKFIQETNDAYPDEIERNRYYYKKAIENIRNDPVSFIKLIAKKLGRFWALYPHTSKRDIIVSLLSFGVMVPFFIYGMIYSIFMKRESLIFFVIILYNTLFYSILFYGSTRFRFPLEPYIIIYGALGLVHLVDKIGFLNTGAFNEYKQG